MKRTPLYEKHLELGAKMVTYAGYQMPVQYRSVLQEHRAVRDQLGIFDVSHMGEFSIEGPNALELIQRITTNDAARLKPGQAQYSCMTNPQGGIIDDLILYCFSPEHYMLVVNAANIEKDWNWIRSQDGWQTWLKDQSDDTALLAVQGPRAMAVLQTLTDEKLDSIPFYHFRRARFGGVDGVLLSHTGYTGSGGLELYLPAAAAPAVWDCIMEAGKEAGITPCGLAARDTLRLEMGYCLYGNDIDASTTPLEAGLGWITKFSKSFTADEVLKRQKAVGPLRKRVAFVVEERGIPRKDYALLDEGENPIGRVTSGTQSPSLKRGIGLGYVKAPFALPGTPIKVKIRDKAVSASIVTLPFYKPN